MTKKDESRVGKSLIGLVTVLPSLYRVATNIPRLLEADVRSTERSLVGFVCLAVISLVLLFSSWFCLLAMLFLYFTSLQLSTMISLLIIFGLNFLLLIIVGLIMTNKKSDLIFPHIRSLLRSIRPE